MYVISMKSFKVLCFIYLIGKIGKSSTAFIHIKFKRNKKICKLKSNFTKYLQNEIKTEIVLIRTTISKSNV